MKNININNETSLKNIKKVIEKKDSHGNDIVVINSVNAPASDNNIEELVKLYRVPQSYVSFLLENDGAKLFVYEDIDGLYLLGSKDVAKYTKYVKNTFDDEWDESIIIFAKIIGEDNYIGFKLGDNDEYVVLDCYFEESPSEWKIITDSFDSFLSEYLFQNGKKFWVK